jgi:NAD-dependent dihydropyrimidine dehydrogenase PreA subunit
VTYVITDACNGTKDRSCVDVCPVDCIHPTSSEEESADEMLYINPDECIDCGACEPACPVTAIFAEDDVPDNMKPYIQINVQWYSDKDAARAAVKAAHG